MKFFFLFCCIFLSFFDITIAEICIVKATCTCEVKSKDDNSTGWTPDCLKPFDSYNEQAINCRYVNITTDIPPPHNVHILQQNEKEITFYLKYNCSNGPPLPTTTAKPSPPHNDNSGHSVGTILLIIFFSCCLGYLLIGATVNFRLVGARGIEIIPNISFWKDLPGLVLDGVKFVRNGCTVRPSDLVSTNTNGYDTMY